MTFRPDPDRELLDIAEYAANYQTPSDEAWDTARYCLLDSLGCAVLALSPPVPAVGPLVPGTIVPNKARISGHHYQLDPVKAGFVRRLGGWRRRHRPGGSPANLRRPSKQRCLSPSPANSPRRRTLGGYDFRSRRAVKDAPSARRRRRAALLDSPSAAEKRRFQEVGGALCRVFFITAVTGALTAAQAGSR